MKNHILTALAFAAALATNAFAYTWTGDAGDGILNTPENWSPVLPGTPIDARWTTLAIGLPADGAAAEAESSKKRAENAIRQAARDIVLKLKAELESRLRRAVSASVKEAMTPAFMTELLRTMAADFAKDPDARITVLASARDADALAAAVRDTLSADFKAEPRVFADASVKGGLQVSFSGDEVFFDFSEEAVTSLVAGYAGEKLAALLENR